MLVDEYQRMGADILVATEKVNASLEMKPEPEAKPQSIPTPADNDRALAELEKMMSGLR